MKTKSIIATSLIALWCAAGASAQSLDLAKRHEINIKTLRLLDSYESYAPMHDDDSRYYFKELFTDGSQYIFNDLMGFSQADSLTVNEYVRLLSGQGQSASVSLKNIRNNRVWEEDDAFYAEVTFDKVMGYSNACGAILDSEAFYGKPYAYQMIVEVDKQTGDAKIRSLRSSMPAGVMRLAPEFTYVRYTSPSDTLVRADGRPLRFVYGQALIEKGAKLAVPIEDMRLKVKAIGQEPCTHYELKLTPVPWRLKLSADISLTGPYSLRNNDLMNTSQSAMDFGADVGYMFVHKGKFTMGAYLGAGYSTGSIKLDVPSLEYNYMAPASADMDGETYRRYYSLSNLKQDLNISTVNVPVYVEFAYSFHSYVSAYFDLGAKAAINMGSKVTDFSGISSSYGVYPQYDDLMIDAPWMNEFGVADLTATELNTVKFNTASFDVFAGLGVRVKIYGPLMLDAGVRYNYGLTPMVSPDADSGALLQGAIRESEAPVTYQVADGTRCRPLTDFLGPIKRNALKLNVGLVIKF